MININQITKLIDKLAKWPTWMLLSVIITLVVLYHFPPPGHTAEFKWCDGATSFLLIVIVILKTSFNFFEQKKLKKTFQLISPSNPNECFCVITKQPDGSFFTQLNFKFVAKNITKKTMGLTRAELFKPFIAGDIIHSTIMVRHQNKNEYGSAEHGYLIQASQLLPISVVIGIRSYEKIKFKKKISGCFEYI